jgi:hypothetical protein
MLEWDEEADRDVLDDDFDIMVDVEDESGLTTEDTASSLCVVAFF